MLKSGLNQYLDNGSIGMNGSSRQSTSPLLFLLRCGLVGYKFAEDAACPKVSPPNLLPSLGLRVLAADETRRRGR